MSGTGTVVPLQVTTIWSVVLKTIAYAQANLSTTNMATSQQVAGVCAQTMRNAREAVNAYLMGSSLSSIYQALAPSLEYDLDLDAGDLSIVTNRVATIRQMAVAAAALQIAPTGIPQLAQGFPAMADPKLLEMLFMAVTETPPAGATSVDILDSANACVTAWSNFLMALQTVGVPLSTDLYLAASKMVSASQHVADRLSNISTSANVDVTTLWSLLAAMPACVEVSNSFISDPTDAASQNMMVMKLVMGRALDQFNMVLVNVQQTVPAQVSLYTIKQNDTLMRIANRKLGDFELWNDIATLNNLVPPYISTVSGPGVVTVGDQIFLPTSSSSVTTDMTTTGTAASYESAYLGIDIYYGPTNLEMLPWTGDFQTISGYDNLSFAVGRRLQTSYGALLFHNTYGSRVPPEIGNVTTTVTLQRISGYAESALLSDPRVFQLNNLNVQTSGSQAISITCDISPNGFGTSTSTVNEVLAPR